MGYFTEKGYHKKISRLLGLLLGLCCWSNWASAAIQPADKATLNHTQIMFAWDEYAGADSYQLSISGGNGTKQLIPVRSLAFLVKNGLHFGQAYRWQYKALKKGKIVYQSPMFSFSIVGSFLVDSNHFRYTIREQQAGEYADNLIFLDHLGVAVNRQGQPVWYLPFDSMAYGIVPKYRNLQITPNGNFVFLKGDDFIEKDRQGRTIWKAPNDGAVSKAPTEFYHHDFDKNPDGSYTVCSYQFVEMPNWYTPSVTSRVRYNTVIQYDAAGEVVWQWNEKDHVDLATIFEGSAPGETAVPGTHMNGLSCNDKTGICVFSFRNNSTLLLIDKATGKVLHTLQGEKPQSSGIAFAAQHGPVFLPNGDVLLYNNNVPNTKTAGNTNEAVFPTILQLRFDKNCETVKKIWEYECRLNEHPGGWAGKEGFVDLLPNGNILICVGSDNTIREVTRSKETVWEMGMTAFDDKKRTWMPFSNYRSHFASSLYPYFFTVQQTSGVNLLKKGQPISIKINNDGTEAALYKVEVFSSDVFALYNQVFRLMPGASKTQTITLQKGTAAPQAGTPQFVVVRITPLDNPTAVKELTYQVAGV